METSALCLRATYGNSFYWRLLPVSGLVWPVAICCLARWLGKRCKIDENQKSCLRTSCVGQNVLRLLKHTVWGLVCGESFPNTSRRPAPKQANDYPTEQNINVRWDRCLSLKRSQCCSVFDVFTAHWSFSSFKVKGLQSVTLEDKRFPTAWMLFPV